MRDLENENLETSTRGTPSARRLLGLWSDAEIVSRMFDMDHPSYSGTGCSQPAWTSEQPCETLVPHLCWLLASCQWRLPCEQFILFCLDSRPFLRDPSNKFCLEITTFFFSRFWTLFLFSLGLALLTTSIALAALGPHMLFVCPLLPSKLYKL